MMNPDACIYMEPLYTLDTNRPETRTAYTVLHPKEGWIPVAFLASLGQRLTQEDCMDLFLSCSFFSTLFFVSIAAH